MYGTEVNASSPVGIRIRNDLGIIAVVPFNASETKYFSFCVKANSNIIIEKNTGIGKARVYAQLVQIASA